MISPGIEPGSPWLTLNRMFSDHGALPTELANLERSFPLLIECFAFREQPAPPSPWSISRRAALSGGLEPPSPGVSRYSSNELRKQIQGTSPCGLSPFPEHAGISVIA